MIGPARPGTGTEQQIAGPSRITSTAPNDLRSVHSSAALEDEDEDEHEDDVDDDDGYGPALPPSMANRKVQGPSRPANLERAMQSEEDSESDDNGVGPLPPLNLNGAGTRLTAADEFRLREKQRHEEEEERIRIEKGKSKRQEWMLVPPSSLDLVGNVDPTRIKSRGFVQNTKKGGTLEKASEEGKALWTETPEERARRLDDEVMGKRKRLENSGKQESEAERRERKKQESRDAEQRARVDAYNVSLTLFQLSTITL